MRRNPPGYPRVRVGMRANAPGRVPGGQTKLRFGWGY